MKVMCISDFIENHMKLYMPKLKVGEIYTVIKETNQNGFSFYLLGEYIDTNFNYWYEQSCFIPLSDIDETELIKQRELVNA